MNPLFPPQYDANGIDANAIRWALCHFPIGAIEYLEAQRYYDGHHHTAFATEKWQNAFGRLFRKLRLNLIPLVIDTINDRLKVESFSFVNQVNEDEAVDEDEFGDAVLPDEVQKLAQSVELRAREIWRRNRMKKRQRELFGEALTKGDAYIVVWPNIDNQATWFLNHAGTVVVSYDPENPGHIIRAAKIWRQDKRIRLTVYYADRLEKYITATNSETLPGGPAAFVRYSENNAQGLPREPWPLPNPYGKVPVFHVANNAPLGQRGRSEVHDLKSPQDGLNKTIMDMMVNMEFTAYPQRWATGVELPIDPSTGKKYLPFRAGVDELWHVGEESANFGEFSTGQLDQFINVKRSFCEDAGMVARVPVFYFTLKSGDVPSGDALEMLEAPLSSKVEDRQTSFGGPLDDAMRLSLEIEGLPGVEVETQWRDTTPRSRASIITTLVQKLQLGISKRQAQREAGYTPSQIKRMASENAEDATTAGNLMGGLFNQGAI